MTVVYEVPTSGYAKIFRLEDCVPVPETIESFSDIELPYVKDEDVLYPGDCVIEGQNIGKARRAYFVTLVGNEGVKLNFTPTRQDKKDLLAQGMKKELMVGSGQIPAMLRLIHAWRMGLTIRGESFKRDTVTIKKPSSVGKTHHLEKELTDLFSKMNEENKKKLVAMAIILG